MVVRTWDLYSQDRSTTASEPETSDSIMSFFALAIQAMRSVPIYYSPDVDFFPARPFYSIFTR